ncbi:MAG TPA: hypothetical protein DDZ80_30720 [Cyanobacteria bacterium UBA8803]|nr:hypothetical protein [Cyanobacteria bacterium UBA9273]HBL62598.1 hypothetical protein [Cyanobacteria bacterium UBA8803]
MVDPSPLLPLLNYANLSYPDWAKSLINQSLLFGDRNSLMTILISLRAKFYGYFYKLAKFLRR